jgi:ABC-type glycerol-3-phosphate transport system permease component
VSSTPSSSAVGTGQRPPEQRTPDRGPTRSGADAVISIAMFVGALVGMFFAFQWMRDTDASRLVVVARRARRRVVGVWAIFYSMDRAVDTCRSPSRRPCDPGCSSGPALLLLSIFLVYPAVYTAIISFQDARGNEWVGWENYAFVFTDPAMLRSIRNSLGWSIVVPLFATGSGCCSRSWPTG